MCEPIISGKISSNALIDSNWWLIMKFNQSPITTLLCPLWRRDCQITLHLSVFQYFVWFFFYFYPLVSTCCMSLMSWWALLIFRSVGQKSSLFSYVEEGGISILQTSLVNVVTVLLRIWELLFVFVSPRFLESRRAWTHLSVPSVSQPVCVSQKL